MEQFQQVEISDIIRLTSPYPTGLQARGISSNQESHRRRAARPVFPERAACDGGGRPMVEQEVVNDWNKHEKLQMLQSSQSQQTFTFLAWLTS